MFFFWHLTFISRAVLEVRKYFEKIASVKLGNGFRPSLSIKAIRIWRPIGQPAWDPVLGPSTRLPNKGYRRVRVLDSTAQIFYNFFAKFGKTKYTPVLETVLNRQVHLTTRDINRLAWLRRLNEQGQLEIGIKMQ